MGESQRVTQLRETYEAFNAGDFERALVHAHPEFELQRPEGGPYEGGTVRGHDAVLEYLAPDAFDQQLVTPLEFTEVGDEVVLVRLTAYARGAGSGIEIEEEVSHVWRIRDGRAVRLEVYPSHARAREAAGLEN